MRRWLSLLILAISALLPVSVSARARIAGFCESGGNQVTVANGAAVSTKPTGVATKWQQSFPGCQVAVYLAGTTTLATIYSDNAGTVTANPFMTSPTGDGSWFFYTDPRVDVTMSGGGIPTPFTRGDLLPFDPALETLDVKIFGAKGDGTTDDTTAIQNALTAAIGAGNARVVFPCSTTSYLISAPLVYGTNTWVTAAANHCATIRVKGGLSQTITMMKPLVVGQQGSKITDLILDQATDVYTTYSFTTQLLSVDGTIGMLVENVEFKNVMTMAIWADSTAANPTKKLQILFNRIDNSLGGGISMFGTLVDHLVLGNIIENTEDDSIAHQWDTNGAPTGFSVIGNMVRHAGPRNSINSTPHCILVYGSVTNFTVSGNTCDSSVAPGIDVAYDATTVHRPSGGTVTGNTVINGGNLGPASVPGQGILVVGADDVSVVGNTSVSSRTDGIRVFQSTDVILTGNTVRLSNDSGIQVEASQRVLLTGNEINDSGNSGISATPYGILLINDGAAAGQFVDLFIANANRSGDTRTGGARTQTYGFYVSGANSGTLRVALNNFQNNLTGALGGLNPATLYRFDNDGDATVSNTANGLNVPSVATGAVTNGAGLQVFTTSTTCTTGASAGAQCTTGAITLPVGYSDTNYRIVCSGLTPTNQPLVEYTVKSPASFTITITTINASAASFASFDCVAGHN